MIIFSDCISEEDRKTLTGLGHTVVNVHPSNVVAVPDDAGVTDVAAIKNTREALVILAQCVGGSYAQLTVDKLNELT